MMEAGLFAEIREERGQTSKRVTGIYTDSAHKNAMHIFPVRIVFFNRMEYKYSRIIVKVNKMRIIHLPVIHVINAPPDIPMRLAVKYHCLAVLIFIFFPRISFFRGCNLSASISRISFKIFPPAAMEAVPIRRRRKEIWV